MYRGNELEPRARELFVERMRLDVSEIGFIKLTEKSILGCSVDGIGDGFIIEIKCRTNAKIDERLVDGISEEQMLQMQWNMFVTDTPVCYAVDYTDRHMNEFGEEDEFLVVEGVKRDDTTIEELRELSREAIRYIFERVKKLKEKTKNKKNEVIYYGNTN